MKLPDYTGIRLTEVIALAWTQVDMAAMTVRIEAVRIEDTKSGEPLEFPVTCQLAAILERRFAEREQFAGEARGWVFPSEASTSGHLESIQHLNARIGEAGGARFWFHALRNCFITVADRELMLPTSLTKRLVSMPRPRTSPRVTPSTGPWSSCATPPNALPTRSTSSLSPQARSTIPFRRPHSGRSRAPPLPPDEARSETAPTRLWRWPPSAHPLRIRYTLHCQNPTEGVPF